MWLTAASYSPSVPKTETLRISPELMESERRYPLHTRQPDLKSVKQNYSKTYKEKDGILGVSRVLSEF